MDTLSRLLLLHPVRTALDTRCQLGAPFNMSRPAEALGIAPYHLIIEGTALLDSPMGKAIPLHAGDMLVFPRGQAHRLYMTHTGAPRADAERPATQVIELRSNDARGPLTDILCGQFRFESPTSNALLDALPEMLLLRTSGNSEASGLRTLVTMLRDETSGVRAGANAVVEHLASALFAFLMRAWLEQADAVPGVLALLADPRLQASLHAMLAQPQNHWSVSQLAEICHMSRATFARRFHATAGATPGEVLLRIRMAQASLWLTQGKRTLGDIGASVGYLSEAAFSRAFKRCVGVGPGKYRITANK